MKRHTKEKEFRRRASVDFKVISNDKVMQQLLNNYVDAYKLNYQLGPRISYVSGWFRVNSSKVRASELIRMTDVLYARAHEKELNAPKD